MQMVKYFKFFKIEIEFFHGAVSKYYAVGYTRLQWFYLFLVLIVFVLVFFCRPVAGQLKSFYSYQNWNVWTFLLFIPIPALSLSLSLPIPISSCLCPLSPSLSLLLSACSLATPLANSCDKPAKLVYSLSSYHLHIARSPTTTPTAHRTAPLVLHCVAAYSHDKVSCCQRHNASYQWQRRSYCRAGQAPRFLVLGPDVFCRLVVVVHVLCSSELWSGWRIKIYCCEIKISVKVRPSVRPSVHEQCSRTTSLFMLMYITTPPICVCVRVWVRLVHRWNQHVKKRRGKKWK